MHPHPLSTRGLKTPVAGWHCHPEDLGLSGRFMAMVFWKPVWKIGPKYVRTVQNMSGQFKMFPDSLRCFRTAQIMSGQPKMCPDRLKFCLDSSKYVRTAKNVSGQVKSFVQTTQNMSGQPKMCPDTSRCVRTVQDMSRQFKMCPDSSKYGRSRKMITHFLGMSRKTYAFFVRKILGATRKILGF